MSVLKDLANVTVPVWLVLAVALIGTGVLIRRAWKRAALEARLERLRGGQR
jgi:ribosomal protein L39E